MDHTLLIAWCEHPAAARMLAEFFVESVTPDYISHGELQLGRAETSERWSPALTDIVTEEIHGAVATPAPERTLWVAVAREGDTVVALALVSFHSSRGGLYGVIEDIVVRPTRRRHGIGHALLDWIEAEVRARGATRLFLESGLHNAPAHAFFQHAGYATCSVTMTKTLST